MNTHPYDVVILGGGASGTALLYTLARYSNLSRIALIEKYEQLGSVNSHARNNSQTLHTGDIETNYTPQKVAEVYPAAMMVKHFVSTLPAHEQRGILMQVQKMVLGVGESEVSALKARYGFLKKIFPSLEMLGPQEIAEVEPEVMRGRPAQEKVIALYNKEGYAVNFGLLAQTLAARAMHGTDKQIDVRLQEEVLKIEKTQNGYMVTTRKGRIEAKVVIVDADAYSLGFAKHLGYGKHFSLIPIAGTFYFTKTLLRGKVYTVQAPRLPFASVHGDPDLTVAHKTRWGPTARFLPILESRKVSSVAAYFTSSGLHRLVTWLSFFSILFEPIRFVYFVKNFMYEWPWVGKYFFTPQVRKIVPTIRARDLSRAKGFGGMRLQRVDTRTHELLLGEGKIVGDNIIFNMTPSPGASVCLYNAMRDAQTIQQFLGESYKFDKTRMLSELSPIPLTGAEDISIRETYPA